MELSSVLSLLVDETRNEMASLAQKTPVRGKAPTLRSLSGLFQAVGICKLLLDADVTKFRENLIRGAQARRYHLRKSREEGSADDDRFLGLSKVEAVFDAIVADSPELLHDVVALSHDQWHEGWEYEDDFCYYLFVHRLVGQPGFLASPGAAALIERFEKALEGQSSARLELCKAVQTRNEKGLRAAFEFFLTERKNELDARRPKITEYTAQAIFWPGSFVSIEALAWLCIAQRNDLEMNDDFLFCPPEARGRHEPLEVEDFFEGLDLALDGAQG